MAKKRKLPPKPDCGSIEVNRMIAALNQGHTENPCPGSPERERWWNSLVKNKQEVQEELRRRGEPDTVIFAYVEEDAYECALTDEAFRNALPDGWLEEMLEEQRKKGKMLGNV